MKLIPLPIHGAFLIQPECLHDERGFFARTFCRKTFEQAGMNPHLEQCSISFNVRKGTLRGMHFQESPYEEVKCVRCSRGAIFDVIVDVRPQSPTFMKCYSHVLTEQNYDVLYIPEGCAHGFETLEENSEVYYQISQPYVAAKSKGFRWNDPDLAIQWPLPPVVISQRDQQLPHFKELEYGKNPCF